MPRPHYTSHGPATYEVSGFTAANYFSSAAGKCPGALGTYCLVVRIISLDVAFGVLAAFGIPGGFYIGKNIAGGNKAIGGVCYLTVGSKNAQDFIPFDSSDIGKCMVLHFTGDSTAFRDYVAGAEINVGTATGLAPTAPPGTEQIWYGRWSGGNPTGNYSIIASMFTPTVLTPAQVEQHAQQIMSRKNRLYFPLMPGATMYHNAADLAASSASWPDRIGTATMTRSGAVTVTKLTAIRWVRNAGNIMAMGDSQEVDGFDTFKAAQFAAIKSKMDNDGIHYVLAGPFTTGWIDGVTVLGHHRAVSGETSVQAITGSDTSGITLATYIAQTRPRWTLPYWLTNDFGVDGIDIPTAVTRMDAVLAVIAANAPWCHIWMMTLGVPQGPMYIGTQALFIAWNAQLPAYCDTRVLPYGDIGNPARFPDGLHFLGGATGYGIWDGTQIVGPIAVPTGQAVYSWIFGA